MATLTCRKLIRLGSALAMTVPKAWTDYYQLKPGDKVTVVADKKLLVRPISRDKK